MSAPWVGVADPRDLSASHFEAAAARLGCDVAAIRAVWDVEAGGAHFQRDGSVIRRFEPHHFPRESWLAIGYTPRPGAILWRESLRLSSETMFRRAWGQNPQAALRASSWGAPQVMGFNAQAAGFGTPTDMVRHMARGADHQLGAFVQLIEGWGLASALRGHDWTAFARRYNGDGQVEEYARRMEAAYRRHSGQRSPVVLRVGDRGRAVGELQRALGIDADEVFGPETLRAVMLFQERRGLAVDGVVGHRTWTTLQASPVEVVPHPPAQATPAAERADLTAQLAAGTAAVTGIAGATGTLRDQLPPELWQVLIWGAAGLALVYGAALLWRRLAIGTAR